MGRANFAGTLPVAISRDTNFSHVSGNNAKMDNTRYKFLGPSRVKLDPILSNPYI